MGPTVIYLGHGWALTARHVGVGEIRLRDEMIRPAPLFRRHTLMNVDASPADLMVFALDPDDPIPDLAPLPLAHEPAQPGEEVVMIGFGYGGGDRIRVGHRGELRPAIRWNDISTKRWGTNRVEIEPRWLSQGKWITRSLIMRFDEPDHPNTTRLEAQAATGDSGGPVFVKRDGRWLLTGVTTSVSGSVGLGSSVAGFGDHTYAADVSFYRSEIIRWTRPACSNELDDDGDGAIDHPSDPDCSGPGDEDERPGRVGPAVWGASAVATGIAAWTIFLVLRSRGRDQRGSRTPSSTRLSSAD